MRWACRWGRHHHGTAGARPRRGRGAGTDTISGADATTGTDTNAGTDATTSTDTVVSDTVPTIDDAADDTWDTASVVHIHLANGASTADGDGVTIDGDIITITRAATYQIDGSLTDGQVVVDAEDAGLVRLLLNGVAITSETNAPLAILGADRTAIILLEGTTNTLTDATAYIYAKGEDEPNAALFSKDDLGIHGPGALHVTGRANDGITSKDALVIHGGVITVDAADDGIRGKDNLVIRGGTITVDAAGDGLKADEADNPALGGVYVTGGDIDVTAGDDGVAAERTFEQSGGTLTITAGGGATGNTDGAKGVAAGVSLMVLGGTLNVDASDDSVHSDDTVTIAGGTLNLATGDDGIHAEVTLTVTDGDIRVTRSYEGLEAQYPTLSGGNIHVVSSDDGINGAGDCGGDSGGGPGGPGGMTTGTCRIDFLGSNIVVNAQGDGLDVNGNATMTGGRVLVHGPIQDNNGAVDYDGTFVVSGGTLVAAGSARMAQTPGTSSSQPSVLITFSATVTAGTLVRVEKADGTPVVTFAPDKNFATVALSSPLLTVGETFTVYRGGSVDAEPVDGLYTHGTYTGGTSTGTFPVSTMVTRFTAR